MNVYVFKFRTLISQFGNTWWAIHLHDICHDSAGKERNNFQQLIKILHLDLNSLLLKKVTHYQIGTCPHVISGHNKISSLFIMKSLLNVNLYTWSAFISHVVCLGKTSNSWYKYSGPFPGQTFCGIHRIPNVFKIKFFPVENIYFFQFFDKFIN